MICVIMGGLKANAQLMEVEDEAAHIFYFHQGDSTTKVTIPGIKRPRPVTSLAKFVAMMVIKNTVVDEDGVLVNIRFHSMLNASTIDTLEECASGLMSFLIKDKPAARDEDLYKRTMKIIASVNEVKARKIREKAIADESFAEMENLRKQNIFYRNETMDADARALRAEAQIRSLQIHVANLTLELEECRNNLSAASAPRPTASKNAKSPQKKKTK
jgi:hypothetical protein